jgi:hypothetical protein
MLFGVVGIFLAAPIFFGRRGTGKERKDERAVVDLVEIVFNLKPAIWGAIAATGWRGQNRDEGVSSLGRFGLAAGNFAMRL